MKRKKETGPETKAPHDLEEELRAAALSSEVKRLIRSRLLPKPKAGVPAAKRPSKGER